MQPSKKETEQYWQDAIWLYKRDHRYETFGLFFFVCMICVSFLQQRNDLAMMWLLVSALQFRVWLDSRAKLTTVIRMAQGE